MKNFKKTLALLAALALSATALYGCGPKEESSTTTPAANNDSKAEDSVAEESSYSGRRPAHNPLLERKRQPANG